MPRIVLNPAIDGISGRLKNIVFVNKSMSPKNNIVKQGYIRSHGNSVKHSVRQTNTRIAFKLITSAYKQLTLNSSAFNSWVNAAQSYSVTYTVSTRSLYYSFYLAMWSATSSGWWKPSGFVKKSGFGAGKYGAGKYGVPTIGLFSTWSGRFSMVFV